MSPKIPLHTLHLFLCERCTLAILECIVFIPLLLFQSSFVPVDSTIRLSEKFLVSASIVVEAGEYKCELPVNTPYSHTDINCWVYIWLLSEDMRCPPPPTRLHVSQSPATNISPSKSTGYLRWYYDIAWSINKCTLAILWHLLPPGPLDHIHYARTHTPPPHTHTYIQTYIYIYIWI